MKNTSITSVRVHLPRLYIDVLGEWNINAINAGIMKLHILYHSACEKSGSYILSLKVSSVCVHGDDT